MKLYHGSKVEILNPIPHGSNKDNDYGPAFYTTRDLESAHEWACKNGVVGYVNEYEFNIKNLKVLDLSDKSKYSVLNWVAILLHYRSLPNSFIKACRTRLDYLEEHYYIDVNEYDVVIGFRADDAYFRFPLDFVRGNLTLDQLEYSYQLGTLGIQYVLISEKAFKYLQYIKAIKSEYKYINNYFETVKKATNDFDALDKDSDGIRIIDIIRGNIK